MINKIRLGSEGISFHLAFLYFMYADKIFRNDKRITIS